MPSFLSLPQEIRESILEEVLRTCHPPPAYPSTSGRIDFYDIDYQAWRSKAKIYHEQRSSHCPSNCLPLLLANRQIHDETQSVLNRKKFTYVLDISVLNDYDVFPTWVSVPFLTNRIYALAADVRLFGIPSSEFEDRDITVEILTLDFQSAESVLPFPPDSIHYYAWQNQHFASDLIFDESDSPNELEKYRTRPEWPARYFLSEIYNLLAMSYHTASYGKILFERIGTILIIWFESLTEIDLASRLAALHFTNPQDTFGDVWPEDRLSTFWKWKKQTLTRREELGFPVVWPDDRELKDLL
ncbi:hypothetical protein N7474_004622 [Penicillium riverlandense]|uniref:uncharacterized protein n=1 Tax=Penicillium riverlandense TaxID=1903569 RepID=UPI0025496C89|nr:uncharacterized protein N7474_004622 [Penicillium riverlandense]KAJ5819031.1 hypothetical protein N7474_004622 [Penicillium riverlandense]